MPDKKPTTKAGKKSAVSQVMHEIDEVFVHLWGTGKLHSGSKKGPKVTNQKQAVAIALSESGQSKKSRKK